MTEKHEPRAVGSISGIKGWQQLIGLLSLSVSILALALSIFTAAYKAGRAIEQHNQILANEALILKALMKDE